jgi:hypothetical protein
MRGKPYKMARGIMRHKAAKAPRIEPMDMCRLRSAAIATTSAPNIPAGGKIANNVPK